MLAAATSSVIALGFSLHFVAKSASEDEKIKFIEMAQRNQSLISELQVNGESIYAVITCSGKGIRSDLFPTEQPILFGRIKIKESTETTDVGLAYGGKHTSVVMTSHTDERTTMVSIPECPEFESDVGPVSAEDLENADYEDMYWEKCLLYPKDANPLLKKLGMRTNFSADRYDLSKIWYEAHQKPFIFAELSRKENGFRINMPKQGHFFIATKTPQALMEQATINSMRAMRNARFSFVASVAFAGVALYKKVEMDAEIERARGRW